MCCVMTTTRILIGQFNFKIKISFLSGNIVLIDYRKMSQITHIKIYNE